MHYFFWILSSCGVIWLIGYNGHAFHLIQQQLDSQLGGTAAAALSAQLYQLILFNGGLLLLVTSTFFLAIYVQQRQQLGLAQEKNTTLEQEQQNLKAFQRVLGSMYQDLEMEKEKALQGMRANTQLAAIVKESRDAIIGLAAPARITSANQAACELFGWLEPPLGQSILQLTGSSLRKQISPFLRRAMEGEASHLNEVLWQRGSGTLVISMSFSPIMDTNGSINGISLIARNITDQVNENKRFRLAVEASPNAMIMTNAEGDIVLLNSKAEQIFGYTEPELLGQSVDLLIPRPLRQRHLEHRNRFMLSPTTRAMGANRELFALHKNGEHIPVEIGLTHLQRDGSTYVISSIVDISERLQAQRALSRLNRQLLQRNKESEQFVYTVSHDLKAPLVTISGFARRLAASLSGQLTPKQEHQFERIAANIKTMEELLEDLLQLSRVISRTLECTLVDTEVTVKQVIEALAGALQNTGGEVHIERPLPRVYAQERLLFQCLQNLIGNAINYRRPDSPPIIRISGDETEEGVQLAVEDNGVGIEAQYLEKIFGLFERLNAVGSGTGVGLSIVKSAMEKHGGQVTVRSVVGKGSVFTLHFPHRTAVENLAVDSDRALRNEQRST